MNALPISPTVIPLSRLPAGTDARVARLDGQENVCQRLREMGFCESAIISRLSGHGALVCQVCGSRIALHRAFGDNIHVEPIGVLR
jgi:ferrous iron transport protein A